MSADTRHTKESRVWVVFHDENGREFHFDQTFMLSGYNCIWGQGCKGIYKDSSDNPVRGCCAHSFYFDGDQEEIDRVTEHVNRLTDTEWQNKHVADKDGRWDARRGTSIHGGRVVGGKCIFYNDDDWEHGGGCALHLAALNRGEDYIDWKPAACVMVPLDVDASDYDEETNEGITYVAEYAHEHWSRNDDEPGERVLDWWCTEDSIAFQSPNPLYVTAEKELRHFIGDVVYEKARDYFDTIRQNTKRERFLPLLVNPNVELRQKPDA